ncbi:hypothetical protein K7X08_020844 [Anisodus acutangulus]|uniref:Uncharacterized protein n=1 Tax=Anisodus acutangulus TaxID=402998 RepID=A0A9Q1RQD0_9SOLA|nr:hypothetical protein K7X08_020844 [Anisodus acutangulus]
MYSQRAVFIAINSGVSLILNFKFKRRGKEDDAFWDSKMMTGDLSPSPFFIDFDENRFVMAVIWPVLATICWMEEKQGRIHQVSLFLLFFLEAKLTSVCSFICEGTKRCNK